jgi:predicted permease
MGVSTSVFSIVDTTAFRKLPVSKPDELVLVQWTAPSRPQGQSVLIIPSFYSSSVFSYRAYKALREPVTALADVFAVAPFSAGVVFEREPGQVTGEFVSGNYHAALGVPAAVGRTLTEGDDESGAPVVAVISHRYWRERLDSDPQILGKRLTLTVIGDARARDTRLLENLAVTIVGVTQAGFAGTGGPTGNAEIFVPLSALVHGKAASRLTDASLWWLHLMGRRLPGATAADVRAELEPVFAGTLEEGSITNIRVEAGGRGFLDSLWQRPALLLMPAALLLFIGCVNLSNLLLARATARQKEIATRRALGASTRRILRQLLTETVALATIGGALGVLLSVWSKELLSSFLVRASRDALDLRIDLRVLAFAAAVSVLTGLLFGLLPALRMSRADLMSFMKGTSSASSHRRPSHFSKYLLTTQVAASLVLIVIGGLFLSNMAAMLTIDPGFDIDKIIRLNHFGGMWTGNPGDYLENPERIALLREEVVGSLRAVPGVVGVTVWRGGAVPDSNGVVRAGIQANFFTVMGVPIIAGRGLVEDDGAQAAVINETMARRFFSGESPLGKELPDERGVRIVGVAKDVRLNGARRAAGTLEPILPTSYRANLSDMAGATEIAVRTFTSADALLLSARRAVLQVHPYLMPPQTQAQVMLSLSGSSSQFGSQAAFGVVLSCLAVVGLLLVAVGLYGITSYIAEQRTREFGIRIALGARPRQVMWLVQKETMRVAAVGVAAGFVVAVALVLLIGRSVSGVVPLAPGVALFGVCLVVAVASLAGYLPSQRASRSNPLVSLRNE